MEENFTGKELKLLYFSLLRIGRLYVKGYNQVYLGAKKAAKRARLSHNKNAEKKCYKQFREETGLSMREFCKLRRLCGLSE